MQNASQRLRDIQKPPAADVSRRVWLEVIDQGAENGIVIRVFHPITDELCFEIVTLDPDDCPLIGKVPQSDACFGAFYNAVNCAESIRRIFVLIQFHHRVSKRFASDIESDARNGKIYRMVEDIIDEIQTHRPGSMVEIGMRDGEGSITSLM